MAIHSISLPGGHSEWEPPDSIPNSVVKTLCADDSVGSPHVKVGHCQAFIINPRRGLVAGVFSLGAERAVGRRPAELSSLALSSRDMWC